MTVLGASGGLWASRSGIEVSVCSSLDIRVATSLIVALRTRGALGSFGGYKHTWPPREHGVQGYFLSQRTLRRRHVAHERSTRAVEAADAGVRGKSDASGDGDALD